ncbi:MAG: hypothetical protein EAZ08_07275 [Cytophagales bacterium]|nr:MAG: hypothetical protein EAZ08_07275 [Cytophagales bacterium]
MKKSYLHILLCLIGIVFWGCSPAENPFPKELKNKLLGTWTLEKMTVLQKNNTTSRWDTVPNLPAETFTKATLTFENEGSYQAYDPTYNRSTGLGVLFYRRFDFIRGWARNSPYGGLWEFVDNYTTIHFDRGYYEINKIPAEKWVIEAFSDTQLRIFKDATLRNQHVWYTFKK